MGGELVRNTFYRWIPHFENIGIQRNIAFTVFDNLKISQQFFLKQCCNFYFLNDNTTSESINPSHELRQQK
jgi:hypothetical protein